MNIVIFDTETTSLDKPFCYNIGYVIANTETGGTLKTADYIVEQVWHNPMLFTTAYYANKREDYVKAMRCRKTTMDKFGYICQAMIRDFKAYEVELAFAYNSPFDEKVFNYNCDWFKCNNPFDNLPIVDIRGFAHHYLIDDTYKKWCEENGKFTDGGNYSTTAEVVYQYISNNLEFIEEHTALSDSIIETEILFHTLKKGAEISGQYEVYKSIPRLQEKDFTVKYNDETVYTAKCNTITYRKTNHTVLLKGQHFPLGQFRRH